MSRICDKAHQGTYTPGEAEMARNMDTYDLEYVPLRIFVIWNPAFEYGFGLARELYEWFGGPNRI